MSTLKTVISVLVEQVSEQEFWKFVDSVGWNTDHDYNRIKSHILNKIPRHEVEQIKLTYDSLLGKLDDRLENVISGVGDDGYSDLLAHIIGSGKQFFDSVMKDPSIAQRLADSYEYKESFSYSFPYNDDWLMMSDAWWKKTADRMLEQLNSREARASVKNEHDAAILKDLIRRYGYIYQGKFEKAFRGWDKEKYAAYTRSNLSKGPLMWGPPNYLKDLEIYKIKQ